MFERNIARHRLMRSPQLGDVLNRVKSLTGPIYVNKEVVQIVAREFPVVAHNAEQAVLQQPGPVHQVTPIDEHEVAIADCDDLPGKYTGAALLARKAVAARCLGCLRSVSIGEVRLCNAHSSTTRYQRAGGQDSELILRCAA